MEPIKDERIPDLDRIAEEHEEMKVAGQDFKTQEQDDSWMLEAKDF